MHTKNKPANHQVSRVKLEMHITQEELNKTQIPHIWRDYCAHLLPELNKCRMDNYYKPWKCEFERTAWQKCQYDEYFVVEISYHRRMRKLSERKALQEIGMESVADELE